MVTKLLFEFSFSFFMASYCLLCYEKDFSSLFFSLVVFFIFYFRWVKAGATLITYKVQAKACTSKIEKIIRMKDEIIGKLRREARSATLTIAT